MQSIVLFVVTFINLLLGIVVFVRHATSLVHRRFFIFSIAVSVWVMTNGLFSIVGEPLRFKVALASYGAAALTALYFLLFTRAMKPVQDGDAVEKSILAIGWIVAILSMTPGVVGVSVGSDLTIETNTAMLVLYGLVLVTFFVSSIIALVKMLRGPSGKAVRASAKTILVGFFIAVCIGVTCNLLLPLQGNYSYVHLGPLGSFALVTACSYAIVRHRLFDVRLVAVRTVVYGLSLMTLSVIYFLSAYVVSFVFFEGEAGASMATNATHITLALLLAFIFQPIKQFFDQVTNNIFYRDRYDTSQFYANLSELLSGTTDLRRLLQKASVKIGTTLKAESAFFFVRLGDKLQMTAGEGKYRKLPPQDITVVIDYVARHGDDIIVTEQLGKDSHQLRRLLVSHKIALLLPLVHGNAALGFFALGDQRGRGYDGRDIRTLTTVADELIIAINHALVVQEIKEINEHLEQRIDAATRELRSKNLRLQRLDATKDEFLSMASHQLRTPLTSIKGYLSMVLEGDAGKVPAKQRQLLEEAFNGSGRMVRLIHDFLNISRLQTGKFALEYHRSDIVKIVNDEVRLLASPAKSRHIRLRIHSGIPTAELYIDENKVRQVVMNLIDNALYYSHEKSTVDIRLHRSATHIEFSVSDTGIGVPTDEQDALFTKFYRASNARQQRPDGTGIGLFLAKKVITAHGGEVTYVPHKRGSTFGFKLPLSLADKHSH